jgi:hypothetical protein
LSDALLAVAVQPAMADSVAVQASARTTVLVM